MRAIKALVAASALLLFLGLGASTIWDANEAFYTHLVQPYAGTKFERL